MRDKSIGKACTIAMIAAAFGSLPAMSTPAAAGSFTSFDPPGSINTSVTGIDSNGDIVGLYDTQDSTEFAYERLALSGQIVTFGIRRARATLALGINGKGQIVGSDQHQSGDFHCFLKKKLAKKTISCDPASAITARGLAINNATMIAGDFNDGINTHGFIWTEDGVIGFDAPGAISTTAESISDTGATTGPWIDADHKQHGFIRDAGGAVTEFDVPGAFFTVPVTINTAGMIAGRYEPGGNRERARVPGQPEHSFFRDELGNVIVFDPPGAETSEALDINKKGIVVGQWFDAGAKRRGYQRQRSGAIRSVDFPGAAGTIAEVINDKGQIGGIFIDADGAGHGFLFNP